MNILNNVQCEYIVMIFTSSLEPILHIPRGDNKVSMISLRIGGVLFQRSSYTRFANGIHVNKLHHQVVGIEQLAAVSIWVGKC